jgi:PAS domain S-box-containing protein
VPAYAAVLIATLLVSYAVAYSSTHGFADQLRRISELGRGQAVQVQALRASEERFAALFRANPVPSSTNDRDGRILDVNRAWSAMFGFPVEAVLGKTTLELGIWAHGESRRTILDTLHQQGRVDGAPLLLKVADGQIRPFLVFIAPVEFGGESRYVTSLLDQSDRQAAERAQAQVTEQLEARVAQRTTELTRTLEQLMGAQEELLRAEKLASLGAMVAGISHELNTPIGNTVTVASTMHHQVQEFGAKVHAGNLKRSDLSSFLELMLDMSDVLSRSTTRAAELISSFKQVAVDQASERRRDFNVKELVDDIVTSVRAGMREGVATISHDVPEDLQCDSYPGPVGQILLNLIQNAQVHAFHGRDAGHIHIQAREVQAQLVMEVSDDGVGMTPEVLKRAFDPFFTTRLGKGGSGLGLSLSYRLATATLGGNLTVSSSAGKGCCFTLTFPCSAPVDPTVALVTPEPVQGS